MYKSKLINRAWRFSLILLACFLLAATGGALPATQAVASSVAVSAPALVSNTDPLHAPNTPGWCGSYADQQDWESETTVAVNPTNPDNIAAAWIQDFSDAILVAYSTDGGDTWTVAVPPTTPCTGGVTQFGTAPGAVSAIDEHLSFGPDGMLYLSFNVGPGVAVNTSPDGGKTWSPPYVVDAPDFPFGDDWTNVLADPYRAGYAYVLWNRTDRSTASSIQYVSHTTDGGKSWSPPAPIISPLVPLGGQFLVLPDQNKTLVNIVAEVPQQPAHLFGVTTGPVTLVARRSTDLGETWSPPTVIAIADLTGWTLGGAALAPNGTIYVVWQTPDVNGSSFTLNYSKSNDGGQSWQQPSAIGAAVLSPPDTSSGGVAVAPDGTIGVTFYDHRNDIAGTNPPRVTDFWLRYSRDGGASWTEQHLAGPFDQTTAPSLAITSDYPTGAPGRVAGGSLGDYQGMAAIPGGFVNSFVLAKPVGSTPNPDGFFSPNPTDIYSDRVHLKH